MFVEYVVYNRNHLFPGEKSAIVNSSYNGWECVVQEMEEHTSDLRGSRGACLCGALFVRMAVGNFLALVGTLVSKRQYRRAALSRSHSRQTLTPNNGSSNSKAE